MFRIALSQLKALPFDFEAEVKKYITALEAHRATEGEASPAPVHAWVEAAVARKQYAVEEGKPDDFVPAYEVIDDSPPPLTLDERKTELANAAIRDMQAAIAVVEPRLKKNLWDIQHGDAQAAVAVLNKKVDEGSVSRSEYEKLASAHKAIIAEHVDRQVKVQAAYRHLAQLHSDIHDLTETTIDGWKPAPFPT